MIRIRDLSLPPAHNVHQLPVMAAKVLGVSPSEIRKLSIVKRSVDARKKQDIRIIYTVDVTLQSGEAKLLKRCRNPKVSQSQPEFYRVPKPANIPAQRPVVIGFGPAGMFAALVLAEAGLRPIVLERGGDAQSRHEAVMNFWETGTLDPENNVQFGEGGAGTFSDGKLTTGTRNTRNAWVLEQMVEAGAQEEILYDAKPHIGTDVLLHVVQNVRRRIEARGGEVRFHTKVTGFQYEAETLTGVELADGSVLPCRQAILCIGHSARDTFEALLDAGITMEPKPFSMGVRIEHPQKMINEAQYGPSASDPALPPADYKLNCRLPDGTSAYTFCMCPGGTVVAAASESGHVVTNGMSYAARDGENANAALLVTLTPEDFPDPGVLSGMRWQQAIEEAAFLAGGSDYKAPAQLVGDFLAGRPSTKLGSVLPTYRPGVTLCDLHAVLPPRITGTLEQAIPALARHLHGFDAPDAVLTAPETRSSSPVRICRDESRQSSVKGLFPAGEGAGYAGGILSAAVDGMSTAEALINSL